MYSFTGTREHVIVESTHPIDDVLVASEKDTDGLHHVTFHTAPPRDFARALELYNDQYMEWVFTDGTYVHLARRMNIMVAGTLDNLLWYIDEIERSDSDIAFELHYHGDVHVDREEGGSYTFDVRGMMPPGLEEWIHTRPRHMDFRILNAPRFVSNVEMVTGPGISIVRHPDEREDVRIGRDWAVRTIPNSSYHQVTLTLTLESLAFLRGVPGRKRVRVLPDMYADHLWDELVEIPDILELITANLPERYAPLGIPHRLDFRNTSPDYDYPHIDGLFAVNSLVDDNCIHLRDEEYDRVYKLVKRNRVKDLLKEMDHPNEIDVIWRRYKFNHILVDIRDVELGRKLIMDSPDDSFQVYHTVFTIDTPLETIPEEYREAVVRGRLHKRYMPNRLIRNFTRYNLPGVADHIQSFIKPNV